MCATCIRKQPSQITTAKQRKRIGALLNQHHQSLALNIELHYLFLNTNLTNTSQLLAKMLSQPTQATAAGHGSPFATFLHTRKDCFEFHLLSAHNKLVQLSFEALGSLQNDEFVLVNSLVVSDGR